MKSIDTIETQRLRLTRMTMDDLPDLVPFYADAKVTATLGGVRTPEWVDDYVRKQIAHWDEHGFGFWMARDRQTAQFVGRGGLRYAEIEGKREIEVGYGFLFEFWGSGLATELAIESVRVGFQELRLPELVCFTLTTNRASQRVMQKAGFRYERDVVYADLPHLLYRQSPPSIV